MLHLRLVVPPEQMVLVIERLENEPGATNLIVLPRAARNPSGDVVLCDIVREAADSVIEHLRRMGLEETGSISVEEVDTFSRSAQRAREMVPGEGIDAVVWSQVTERTSEESVLSVTYLSFLTIATMIAAIGALLDQPILIVGAMVVSPEFGPLAGLCVALARGQRKLARLSLRALVIGFLFAIAGTVVVILLGRIAGMVEGDMLNRSHPLTDFISQPDEFSFVVAFLAGIVGILSLTSAKSAALIGVLISVTTVPAAGSAALAIGLGRFDIAWGSFLQLAVNLAGVVVSGTLTLVIQRWLWQRTKRIPTPG